MKKNRIAYLLVVLIVGLSVSSFASIPLKTNYPVLGSIETMKPNGDFFIFIQQGDTWHEVGRLSYDMFFREQNLDLDSFLKDQAEIQVRLVQKGGGAAHIDSVFLGGKSPKKVELAGKETDLKKFIQTDFDVIDATGKSIDFVFPADAPNKRLSVSARIEGERISKIPFQFPVANTYKETNRKSAFYVYHLTPKNAAVSEPMEPFFAKFCRPGTG